MALLRFRPAAPAPGGEEVLLELSPLRTVLVEAMRSGVPLRHDCGGRTLCGTCRIELGQTAGSSPIGTDERKRLEALGIALDGRIRLACRTHLFRDNEARGLLAPEGGEKKGEEGP
jgi:ferredoxin